MASSRSVLINQALMRIPRRADNVDRKTLVQTFVSIGPLFAMLSTIDHQILFGRRGTGKTHALFCLAEMIDDAGDLAIYLDLRTIGSVGGLYSDPNIPLPYRGTQLLIDMLEAIHDALLERVLHKESDVLGDLLSSLDALADAATSVEVVGEIEQETKIGRSTKSRASSEGGIALLSGKSGISLNGTSSREAGRSSEVRTRRTGEERHHVLFGPLSRALQSVVDNLNGSRLWILLDEWSSVPIELQPILADLLRRSLFPIRGLSVKIAAIERRSRFRGAGRGGDYLGIEVGADTAAGLDLDNFLIFDRDDKRARTFFRTLLFNHVLIQAQQPDRLGRATGSPGDFTQATFKNNAFAELVRAAEGVPRDAINLAALAAQHAENTSIGIHEIRAAAREWYIRDKQGSISANPEAQRLLRMLVNEVVGKRQARTFLLDESAQGAHPALRDLYDARLVHVLRRGIVAQGRPGTQYDGFAIDYGCYVALILNSNDFRYSNSWFDTWLRAPRDVAPDNFQDILRSVIDLDTLRIDSS